MKKKKQNSQHINDSENCCIGNDGSHNSNDNASTFKIYLPATFSFVMLITGIIWKRRT